MKFIDFHNHILPNIDDGSKDIGMTINMLNYAANQGIEEIVTTVHFLHPMMDGKKKILDKISEKVSLVNAAIAQEKINIKLHVATEIYFMPELLDYVDEKYITTGNGKYILIEFPVNNIPDIHKKIFFELKLKGITPIIAHPERYKDVQENFDLIYEWLELGYIIQVDAGSILNKLGKDSYKASQFIVKNQLCQLIGSDAHNTKKRNFMLYDAYKACHKIVGDVANNWVYYNPKKIINGEKIKLNFDCYEDRKSIINRIYDKIKGSNDKKK